MRLLALSLSLWTLGDASPHCFGIGHARVTKFLMSSLQKATQQRYESALQHLNSDLVLSGTWPDLSDREKDAVIADWMVKASIEYGLTLSAFARIEPGVSFKLSWKVYDVWCQLQSAQQAPA